MEINLTNEAVLTQKSIYDGTLEQSIDCEINLPEYCNDILRILKCQITPGISNSTVIGNRLTIEGQSNIRMFYADEACRTVRCYEQTIPFVKTLDLPDNDCSSPFVSAACKLEYCNCRAVNQRRVDIHGAFSIHAKVTCQDADNLLTSCCGEGIQLKSKEVECVNHIGSTHRMFSINEVFEIGQSKPTIKTILNCTTACVVTETKVISNKILVKADMKLKVLYCPDTKEEEPQMIESVIPTSQIIDLEGIEEDHLCDVTARLGMMDIMPKADANGEYRMVEAAGKICIEVTAYESKRMKFINDAYSVSNNLLLDRKSMTASAVVGRVSETVMSKNVIDFGQASISKVFDIFVSSVSCHVKTENTVLICGTMTINILFADGEEKVSFLERAIDFEYDTKLLCEEHLVECAPVVTPINIDYSIQGSSRIDVRIEKKIEATVMRKFGENIICAIAIDEENPKNFASPALSIYFASENESIWDIARKFNSTEDAIYAENDISGEIVTKPLMLLIPGV